LKYEARFKTTECLSQQDIDTLIEIKQQHWPYPYEAQIKWINDNIKSDDYHLFLYLNDEFVGYLNIVHIIVIMDGREIDDYGIGNVCVSKKYAHIGLGSVLMSVANSWLKKQEKIGFLLCKDELIDFYRQAGWSLLKVNSTLICGNQCYVNIMFYNSKELSSIKPMIQVEINRNF
jgi:predicted GNAT family N-acyltransferase